MIDQVEVKEETVEAAPKKDQSLRGSNIQNRRRKTTAPNISKSIKKLYRTHQEENKKSRYSLKQFARSLAASNDATVAKLWFSNKRGDLDKAAKKLRWETRGATIRATAIASKGSTKK
jgi:hypothetical protein